VIIDASLLEVADMEIWSAPWDKNGSRAGATKYHISITRVKDRVSLSFTPSGGEKDDGLSIPLDIATSIAHAILAAGSEDFKPSWSVDETSRPATQN